MSAGDVIAIIICLTGFVIQVFFLEKTLLRIAVALEKISEQESILRIEHQYPKEVINPDKYKEA